jgi:hypothetical protein
MLGKSDMSYKECNLFAINQYDYLLQMQKQCDQQKRLRKLKNNFDDGGVKEPYEMQKNK